MVMMVRTSYLNMYEITCDYIDVKNVIYDINYIRHALPWSDDNNCKEHCIFHNGLQWIINGLSITVINKVCELKARFIDAWL